MKSSLNPIVIPANPFWTVLRTFGRDEFLAGVISIIITALIEAFFWLRGVPPGVATTLLLAFAGPIFEKIGFFVGHLRDAHKVYSETPIEIRKPKNFYIKKAFQGGTKSLIEDVLVHDPIYAGLMLAGMKFHPGTPAFVLVPIAFGLAVILVALLEVSFNEFRYWRFQKKLFSFGFEKETYLESRLHIDNTIDPEVVLTLVRDKLFPGQEIRTLEYNDHYCGSDELPEFNARTAKIRIRNRADAAGTGWINTFQIVFTRAVEEAGESLSQFRYFPVRKDKFYKFVTSNDDPAPRNAVVATLGQDSLTEKLQPVKFVRRMVRKEELLVSVDTLDGFQLIEIKAYPQYAKHLKEAMRFVMHHFPATQMTHGKSDLLKQERTD